MWRDLSATVTIIYCVIAAVDIVLCVAGLYASHCVVYPSVFGVQRRRNVLLSMITVQHAIIIAWLFDDGVFGKMELPGYLMSWTAFDALARIWKLYRK